MVSELLQHLHSSPWGWGDPPTAAIGAGEVLPTFHHHLAAVLATWGGLGCKLANVTLLYKKGWKQNPWNYRVVSVPGKVTEQIILRGIRQLMQDNHRIRPSQQGLVKGRSCLTFCDPPGDERTAVDVAPWTLAEPLTSSPTELSWKSHQPRAWTAARGAGLILPGWPGPGSGGNAAGPRPGWVTQGSVLGDSPG